LLFVECVRDSARILQLLKHPFLVFQHPIVLSKHPIFFCSAPTSVFFRLFFRRLSKAPAKTVGLGICGFGRETEIHRTNGEGKIRCYFLRGSDRHSLAASRRVPQVRLRAGVLDLPPPDDLGLHSGHLVCSVCHRGIDMENSLFCGVYSMMER
jgi:hypothetical protein